MKKGFTLMELLAVIVVIAIVSTITAPLITDVINSSERGAFEDSVYGIISAVNIDKAESGFNITRVYTITNGVSSPELKTKGSIQGSGTVMLDDDGNIHLSIQYKSWCATKDYAELTVDIEEEACVINSDTSGANIPYLFGSLVPVKWDGTKWIRADSDNPNTNVWYSYSSSNKQWANAVLVKEVGTKLRDYYLSDASIGTEVVAADILAHFVWIPRYKYAIPSGSGARSINIIFETGVPTKSTGNAIGINYYTHPAFTFGSKELTGFWMAKFETTGTESSLTVKPSIAALANIGVANIYNSVLASNQTGNVYGIAISKTNLRLTKNNEWGAVSYLANSTYGKNATLYKNPSTTFITGCAGATATAAGASGCSYLYTTANGIQASTTGNIYGVYDMAGGTSEFVMGNYKEYSGSTGLDSLPEDKYYNIYTSTSSATACSSTICYGQGLSETAGWYSGTSNFVSMNYPWLMRGSNSSVAIASQFAYDYTTGINASNMGYRLTLSGK